MRVNVQKMKMIITCETVGWVSEQDQFPYPVSFAVVGCIRDVVVLLIKQSAAKSNVRQV